MVCKDDGKQWDVWVSYRPFLVQYVHNEEGTIGKKKSYFCSLVVECNKIQVVGGGGMERKDSIPKDSCLGLFNMLIISNKRPIN